MTKRYVSVPFECAVVTFPRGSNQGYVIRSDVEHHVDHVDHVAQVMSNISFSISVFLFMALTSEFDTDVKSMVDASGDQHKRHITKNIL